MIEHRLRFAPLARISTESQQKQGESLRTQKSQITEVVKSLGGVLIPDCWKYSGQEHSTPQFERQRFDQLLKDASKGLFDAVIVVDPSRWSRDNLRSKQGLQILRDHNIRFFTLQIEHDLFDPQAELFLGLSTEFNEYSAKIQAKKSMQSKIARAKRGLPASGSLPYGRTFNSKTETWHIDPEKHRQIKQAARQYLRGDPLYKIAKDLGMTTGGLWKILMRRCGDTWQIKFSSKRIAVNEKVTLKIPPLLDPQTIKKIHEKAEANKTFTHGQSKHQYLLGRLAFCAKCGYAMTGHMSARDTRYYRHIAGDQRKCDQSFSVRADDLEAEILVRLFSTMGDPAGFERAMLKAIPDRKKITELRDRKDFLTAELSKIETGKNRLIDSIEKGLITDAEVEKKMTDIRLREASVKSEIESIEPQIINIPTIEQIKRRAKMIERIVSQIYHSPSRLKRMSFEDRRQLVSSFFGGKDSQGRRLGVYLSKSGGEITYEIRGVSQTSKATLGGLSILDFPGMSVDHFEEVRRAVEECFSGRHRGDGLLSIRSQERRGPCPCQSLQPGDV